MARLIDLKDDITLLLIGGTICTGKDTAAREASRRLANRRYEVRHVSMTEYLREVTGLGEDDPRERYLAQFEGRENEPWLAEGIARDKQAEPGSVVVVSGLRRERDAAYFNETFPKSYFIAIVCDDKTLVERMMQRGRAMDFPEDSSEKEKRAIALERLRQEERVHGITEMIGYIAVKALPDRWYVIDTGLEDDCIFLKASVKEALKRFRLT